MSCGQLFSVGESGTVMVVNAGIVLTTATDLLLAITTPNGETQSDKTLLASELTIGTVNFEANIYDINNNVIDTEIYLANQYVNYPIEAGLLTIDGDWKGVLLYQRPGDTPPVNSPGCVFTIKVIPACF